VQDAFVKAHPESKKWSYGTDVRSPYVLQQGDKIKQESADLIRLWYGSEYGINIKPSGVYFFDDRTENIKPFSSKGLNSHEISCQSRDKVLFHGSGMVGYCGATPEEIQRFSGNVLCEEHPHESPAPAPAPAPDACLCVFDIDRTLTGMQGDTTTCPRNRELQMKDEAYGGGHATLSALAAEGISTTFCNHCYLGITSAGAGSGEGSEWNNYVLDHIMTGEVQDAFVKAHPVSKKWSYGTDVKSPYVLQQGNKIKQESADLLRLWYGSEYGINIKPSSVYFFDDRTENIKPFSSKGLNSHEISCDSRDKVLNQGSGMVGYCGATPEEIQRVSGNILCG